METRSSLLVCLCVCCVLVIHVGGQVGSICRPNERFLPCGGCQRTCKDPDPQCQSVCKTGCYCNDDEVRNATGHCVKLSECPPMNVSSLHTSEPRSTEIVCPENEEYRFCEPCNRTCDNPNPMCPAQCARGCFCAGDLVRDRDGRCVALAECSHLKTSTTPKPYNLICGPHQVYSTCQKCENTCRDPYPVCYSDCQIGCVCEEGYLKTPSGECVKIEDCPKATASCPPNEIYLLCGGCLRTCDMPNNDCGRACLPGCYCREGEVRNATGHCVKLAQCPKVSFELTCGPHQVYNSCQSCERTCSSPMPVCTATCSAGCFCEEGYVKAPSGQCVKLDECPKAEVSIGGYHELSVEDCMPEEIYLVCGWCEPSCSEPRPSCPVGVCTRGCLCRPPLLRHYSGHCVEEKDCVPQRCSDPNEEYVCRYGCEARCDSQRCFARPRRCELGCHCKLGLLRDVNGRCVPPDNCLPRTVRFHPDNSTGSKKQADLRKKTLKHVADTIKILKDSKETDAKKSLNDILSVARDYYDNYQPQPQSLNSDSMLRTYKLITFARPGKSRNVPDESNTYKVEEKPAESKAEDESSESQAEDESSESQAEDESSKSQTTEANFKQMNLEAYINDILSAVRDILPAEPLNFTIINYPIW